jgi:BCCT family betaine/carnitine transporter
MSRWAERSVENGAEDWAPLDRAATMPIAAHGLAATSYHWALHPWAIYAVVALALALFSYNKGLPLTIRSAFYPLLGERVWGWPGHIIDIARGVRHAVRPCHLAGFGAQQANAGLNFRLRHTQQPSPFRCF